MAAKKTSATRTSGSAKGAKKATAKKAAASKTPKKAAASSKKATAKKTAAKSAPKKTAAKKTAKKTAAKPSAKKTTAKKTTAKTTAKKTAAKKTTAKAPARTAAGKAPKTSRTSSRSGATRLPNATVRAPQQRGPKPRPVRPAKFDAAQLKAIRENLIEKRAELQARQEELEEDSFDSTQSEITGEVGLDEDFADAGTATFERERDLSIRNNMYDLIDQMTRAIARIDDGTYGTCERCGRPIDAARLKELPYALLCLDCKRREERAR